MAALAVKTSLRREHLLAVYRIFVLSLLEYQIEILGAVEPALARRLDTAQRRCLALCAGRGGTFASNDTLSELLGEPGRCRSGARGVAQSSRVHCSSVWYDSQTRAAPSPACSSQRTGATRR